MARIIALSSLVARGHVGLTAYRPVLEAFGHEVTGLPTVVLSNHPGHAHAAGVRIDADALRRMIDALDANGWLAEADAVLTGYLPGADHVAVAAELICRVRAARPTVRVVVDPVLGDDPKGLYIDPAAAAAVKERLLALADVVTPNRFELSWLARTAVSDVASAIVAARNLGSPEVVATSVPADTGRLATLHVSATTTRTACVVRERSVPNGTGDVLAALVAAGHPTGQAVGVTAALIGASRGAAELDMIRARAVMLSAPAVAEQDVAVD